MRGLTINFVGSESQESDLKTILICCPYAVNLRNFFLTDTFPTLIREKNVRLVCLTALPKDSEFIKTYANEQVIFEKIEPYQPSRLEALLGHLNNLAFLPHSAWLRYLYGSLLGARLYTKPLLKFFSSNGGKQSRLVIRSLQAARRYLFGKGRYDWLLECYQPAMVVATRLFGTDEYHVLLSAKRRRILTVLVVASWDNLYSYAYMPFEPDEIIAWNQEMLLDAVEKHKVPKKKISIVGPPQFDIYFQRNSLPTKSEYLSRHGLDSSKTLITFTTTDILTDQPATALMIYKTVVAKYEDRQLLIRIHPQEKVDGYLDLPRQYKRLFLDIPGKWTSGSVDRVFNRQDFYDLACCMVYSDVVINVCSTITLDSAVAGTPVICYRCMEPYTDKERMKKVIEAHDLDHFRALIRVNGLRIADSNEQLKELVARYLAHRSLDSDKREAVTSLAVPYRDGLISRRLGEKLLEILNNCVC